MKIAIIGAMDIEINFLVSKLLNKKEARLGNFTFYQGNIFDHDVIIVKSGIGKVMSGILIATLMNNFSNIDKIINVGVAGGLKPLQIADVVIGESYLFGDVDLSSIDDVPYGKMANFPLLIPSDKELLDLAPTAHRGIICTNDKFVADVEVAEEIISKFTKDYNILCFDMESAAYAQSCYFFNMPFLAIRAISDVIGSPEDDFYTNVEKACIASNEFILDFLKNLSKYLLNLIYMV